MTTFTEKQVDELAKRGLTIDQAVELGIQSIATTDQLPKGCADYWTPEAGYLPGLLFTWESPTGEVQHQLRPDVPPTDSDGRGKKYVFPSGSRPILNALRFDADRKRTLIVEGTVQGQVAKLYAPTEFNVLGIAGCWSWTSGGLPSSDLPIIRGHEVLVALDADAGSNLAVYTAGVKLAELLTAYGATSVRFVRIPGSGTTGLDDLLAPVPHEQRTEVLANLIKEAQTRAGQNVDKPASAKPRGDSTGSQAAEEATVLRTYVLENYDLARDPSGGVIGRAKSGRSRVALDLDKLVQRAAAAVYDGEDSIMGTYAARELIYHLGGRTDFPSVTSALRSYHDSTNHRLVIDLGDDTGDVIIVTADGWTVGPNEDDQLWFRRPEKLQPLPRPEQGGSLDDLRTMFPVNDEQWSLILGWLLAAPFVEYERPWLYVCGPRGAGKTGTAVSALSVWDPPFDGDKLDSIEGRDLEVSASNAMIPGFDNASELSSKISDFLATLVTGIAVSRRELFTTADERLIVLKRTGVLTGINVKGIRQDLQERLINVELTRSTLLVSKTDIRRRREADGGWHLGAVLDAVAGVLRKLSEGYEVPEHVGYTRFADYLRILGAHDEQLASTYVTTSQDDRESTALEHPTVAALVKWVRGLPGQDTEKLSAAELLAKFHLWVDDPLTEELIITRYKDARSFGKFLAEQFGEPLQGVARTTGKSNGVRWVRLSTEQGHEGHENRGSNSRRKTLSPNGVTHEEGEYSDQRESCAKGFETPTSHVPDVPPCAHADSRPLLHGTKMRRVCSECRSIFDR